MSDLDLAALIAPKQVTSEITTTTTATTASTDYGTATTSSGPDRWAEVTLQERKRGILAKIGQAASVGNPCVFSLLLFL